MSSSWRRCPECSLFCQHPPASGRCPKCGHTLPSTTPPCWYYATGNQKHGAVSLPQFQDVVSEGVIRPTTMLLRDGSQRWDTAESIPELRFPPPLASLPGSLPPFIPVDPLGKLAAHRCLLVVVALVFFVILIVVGFGIWKSSQATPRVVSVNTGNEPPPNTEKPVVEKKAKE